MKDLYQTEKLTALDNRNRKSKRKYLAFGAIAMFATSCATYAGPNRNSSFIDFAKVTSVDPVYETVIKSVPVEQCWNERVYDHVSRRSHYRDHRESATPALLGAIIGGALGNELGHRKRNKQIGVAVGSIIGASIGRDIGREHHHERHTHAGRDYPQSASYKLVERCGIQEEQYEESVISGYEVAYRYRGNEYTTITDQHPGDKLRVRIKVSPVSF